MPTAPPILEGVTFDHYEVLTRSDGSLHELGRGAMGITYKAFDTNLRVPVALKVINTQNLDNELARERFVQEARSAAKLRHPHVASVFHLGVEGDTYFYAMEFIDGETMEALVKRRGPLPPLVVLRLGLQVARAFGAAQQHGLVHRDIKPSNLMLISEEHELSAKVIDFGLAMTALADEPHGSSHSALSAGGFVGTPHYASPEQLEVKETDIRSDIYSLGGTLWFMLTGETVFSGSMARVMSAHLTEEPPWAKLGATPAPVVTLLKRMLAKKLADRPQNASELRREIEQCLEQGVGDRAQAQAEEKEIARETAERLADSPVSEFATRHVVGGHLEITRRLGETNEGWVFQARDQNTQPPREVRMIVLRQDFSQIPDALTLLEREVERLSSASHPNLLQVYSLETVREAVIVVAEWTQGVTLREVLRVRRALPPSEVLLLLSQIAAGVDFAVTYDVRQLDLALHKVLLHVPGLAEVPEALLVRPLGDWPKFTVKLNPLSVNKELATSGSETWAGAQTMVSGATVADSNVPGVSLATTYTRTLAALAYELFGGAVKPLVAAAGGATRYTPLATLTEEGNGVLRRALDPARGFPKAEDFVRTLRAVPLLESRFHEASPARSASASTVAGQPVVATPQPPKSSHLAIAAVGALVLGLGGAIYFLSKPTAPTPPYRPSTPAPQASVAEPTPAPEPKATPEPEPEPPKPDPLAEQKAAVAEAQRTQEKGNLAKSTEQWISVATRFPEAKVGNMRLEALLDEVRIKQGKLPVVELEGLRKPLAEAADLGVVSAMLLLAESTRASDPEGAFAWFQKASEKGSPEALLQMGLMYSNGEGVAKDETQAAQYLEKAADKNDPAALTAFGECLLRGVGVPKDEARAIDLLQKAVSKGNMRAMNLLGTVYQQRAKTPEDFAEAKRLFEKAAELHYGRAYGNLGVLYMNGDGVKADPRKGVELFLKGAQLDDPFCMYLYARCLEIGQGINPNAAEARTWYKRAAEGGIQKAVEWCQQHKVPLAEKGPK